LSDSQDVGKVRCRIAQVTLYVDIQLSAYDNAIISNTHKNNCKITIHIKYAYVH
jgi:hypothetical protein